MKLKTGMLLASHARKIAAIVLLSGLSIFSVGQAQSAVLQVSGGKLVGASGVKVGDNYYDVTFKLGTCAQEFSGCISSDNFLFKTWDLAQAASQALLDQVLINTARGNFDTVPSLLYGAENNASYVAIRTPFEYYQDYVWREYYDDIEGTYYSIEELERGVNYSMLYNFEDESIDQKTGGYNLINSTLSPNQAWAIWTAADPTPVPAPLPILGAVAAIGWSRKLRRRIRDAQALAA